LDETHAAAVALYDEVSIAFEAILLFGRVVLRRLSGVKGFQSPSRRFFYLDMKFLMGCRYPMKEVSIAFEAILLFGRW